MSPAGLRAAAAVAALIGPLGCGDPVPALPDAGAPDAALPDAAPPDPACPVEDGDGVSFDPAAPPCEKLSSYRLFTDGAAQEPNAGVVPYDVNTPLFSDHASKHRFIWLPEKAQMTYREGDPVAFPVGAVIVKTFGYLDDVRDPSAGERLIETRLLVHRENGWDGLVYQWNEDQTEARLNKAGDVVPVTWTDQAGETRQVDYLVPNTNQCKGCHENADVVGPSGPRARHLNRDFTYGSGTKNQLRHLADIGYLEGAPADPETAPRLPVWDDPDTGTTAERARAWLEINCAHCHNPEGPARVSGLDLRASQTQPSMFGVCKSPIASGGGSGGLDYDIVPGEPDRSIMIFRMESDEPDIQMPELLRQVPHTEGIALVREWIAAMEGSCTET